MSDNWKPGDVAMADGPGYKGIIFRHADLSSRDDEWMTAKEGGYYGTAARRLVVIDPEDREATDRLVDLLVQHGWEPPMTDGCRAALREFANPIVKPEEPTGLGAVVEDAEGLKWIRVSIDHPRAWALEGTVSLLKEWRRWSTVTAVKKLSEGVTP